MVFFFAHLWALLFRKSVDGLCDEPLDNDVVVTGDKGTSVLLVIAVIQNDNTTQVVSRGGLEERRRIASDVLHQDCLVQRVKTVDEGIFQRVVTFHEKNVRDDFVGETMVHNDQPVDAFFIGLPRIPGRT